MTQSHLNGAFKPRALEPRGRLCRRGSTRFLIDDDPESACSQPPGIDKPTRDRSSCQSRMHRTVTAWCRVGSPRAPYTKSPRCPRYLSSSWTSRALKFFFLWGCCVVSFVILRVALAHSARPLLRILSTLPKARPLEQCPVGYIQRSLALDRVGRHGPTGGACSSQG